MKLSDGITLSLDDLLAVSVSGSRIATQLSDGWRTGAGEYCAAGIGRTWNKNTGLRNGKG